MAIGISHRNWTSDRVYREQAGYNVTWFNQDGEEFYETISLMKLLHHLMLLWRHYDVMLIVLFPPLRG